MIREISGLCLVCRSLLLNGDPRFSEGMFGGWGRSWSLDLFCLKFSEFMEKKFFHSLTKKLCHVE